MCRRERDAQIYTAIKKWDIEQFAQKTGADKDKYVAELEKEKIDIEEEFGKT